MLQVLLAVSMLAFDTNGNNLKCFPNKPPSGGLFISNEYLLGVQQLPNFRIFSTILADPLNTFDETKPRTSYDLDLLLAVDAAGGGFARPSS